MPTQSTRRAEYIDYAPGSEMFTPARRRGESPGAAALRRVTRIVEELLRRPDLNFTLGDLQTWLPDIGEQLLQAALRRLMAQSRVMRASSRSSHWFAVPPELQYFPQLPIEIWVDHYFAKIACVPYYVGLLSAASLHGAAAPQLAALQVMLPKVAAQFTLAGTTIHSYLRRHDTPLPTVRHEARWGSFHISTPELTLLDLARPSFRYRAVSNFCDTCRSLAELCKPAPFRDLLSASEDLDCARRLAALLHGTGNCIENVLRDWLGAHSVCK
jgi:hypothetical protein